MQLPHEIRRQPVNEFMRSDEAPPRQFWELSPTSWRKLCQLYEKPQMPEMDNRRVGALGGGTAIDRAKVTATSLGYDCVAIPSMLSTDVFATNKSAVVVGGRKLTVASVLPSLVIVDEAYLKLSEKENRYGVADILSIVTALADWEIAAIRAKDAIDTTIWERAESIVARLLAIPATAINEHLPTVLSLIAEAGYITNDYGSGRPESGSEHIFASALELRMPMLHGAAVSLGIMIMTRAQEADPARVETYLTGLGMIDALNELFIPHKLLLDILTTLQPRKGRYTIVDEPSWRKNIGDILDDIPVEFV